MRPKEQRLQHTQTEFAHECQDAAESRIDLKRGPQYLSAVNARTLFGTIAISCDSSTRQGGLRLVDLPDHLEQFRFVHPPT